MTCRIYLSVFIVAERIRSGDPAPGLGQGLYVARAICQVHGGFLDVRSRPNVGSIFTVGIPLHVEAAGAA